MLIFILAIPLVWTLVLTVHLVQNYRLLLRLLRWTLWIYLFLLVIVMSEVLREGLRVNGDGDFVRDMGFWWFAWAVLVVCAIPAPALLAPAAALPLVLWQHPPFRMLVDFGLARMGWTHAVYSPVLWLLGRFAPWIYAAVSKVWVGASLLSSGSWALRNLDKLNQEGRPLPFGNYTWNH